MLPPLNTLDPPEDPPDLLGLLSPPPSVPHPRRSSSIAPSTRASKVLASISWLLVGFPQSV
ncbi:unnamed protein product [Arabis nemorensis]|uniref:Uncharacterized protein n=1 Tax=Arabis nemorensis TaxID=586526 RepID=A0A565CBH0_9BRAS|nr:unnamed protein product [Arabis nemorensis]